MHVFSFFPWLVFTPLILLILLFVVVVVVDDDTFRMVFFSFIQRIEKKNCVPALPTGVAPWSIAIHIFAIFGASAHHTCPRSESLLRAH